MANIDIDRGWAWLACVGCFIAMFLEAGIVKALGVLLPVLRQQFATKTWIIGLVISLVPAFGAVTCPLAGALSKRFTARTTVMVFGFIAAFGLLNGALSTHIPALVVSFILASFSMGAEAIALGELRTYFDQNYSRAVSLSQTGVSVGIMTVPLATQFSIDVYGWRGTMLLLGALNMHIVLSGVLLKPIIGGTLARKQQRTSTKTFDQLISNEQDVYAKSVLRSVLHKIAYYVDLKLFNDVNFVSIFWFQFGSGYCFTGWLIYLVPYALDVGITEYKAAALATFGGIGNLLGNLIYPLTTERSSLTHILYTSILVTFVALVLNPIFALVKSYIGLSITTAVFGCGRGIATCCSYEIVTGTVHEESRTNSIMWISVAYSFGAITSGFLSGWIYNQLGSFAVSFFILSAVALLSVVPQFLIDVKSRHGYSLVSSSDTSFE